MENLEDIIPLIVMAGLFIYSMAKSSKKSKQQKKEANLPEVIFPEVDAEESIPVKKMENTSFPSNANRPATRKKTNTPNHFSTLPPITEEGNKGNNIIINTDDTEELKKMIIYSEIFNRKYE